MISTHPSARRWQVAAIVLLLAAAAALVAALRAHSRSLGEGGLSALLATTSGEVWLGVDDHLWRASREGRLLHDDALATLGLPRAPANLVQAPDGRIVATVRDDPTLYVLDARSAKVVGRIQPQWPADIAQHGGRAINLAFHDDGRFAIATGAGHLVALFDAAGRFLGRTAPETYRYTNGLWWAGDALWTTDTNRFRLLRLEAPGLAVAETLALGGAATARFLGPARRHPRAEGPMAAMVALVRFENGMTLGRVVIVARDGRETPLAHPRFEPRDVEWLGDDVIATDGVTRSVLRWRADGSAQAPFGDAGLVERLAAGASDVESARRQGGWLRVLAAALFLAALGSAAGASWLERRVRLAAVPLDLSRLGTPQPAPAELTRLQAEVYGPWAWLLLPLLAFQFANGLGYLQGVFGVALLAAAIAGAALAGWLIYRRHARLARDARYERVFNHPAMARLAGEAALATALREGEVVLETFMWLRRPRVRWAVLTTERLLQFHNGFGGWKLESALARGAITDARLKDDRLALRLSDETVLKGRVTAPTVGARVAQANRSAPGLAPPQ